jgi:hypothetical protein
MNLCNSGTTASGELLAPNRSFSAVIADLDAKGTGSRRATINELIAKLR